MIEPANMIPTSRDRQGVAAVGISRTAPSRSRLVLILLLALLPLTACNSPSGTSRRAGSPPEDLASLDTLLANRAPGSTNTRRSTPRDVIVSEEDWTYAGRQGRIINTPHFRLHTTVDRSLLLDRFPRFIEIALASYRTDLGDLPEPGRRLDTYVMRNRPQWESLTRKLTGPRAEVYLRIPRGGYAVGGKGVYYDIGPRDTLAIAGHEGWHQYTQSTFKHPLPLWLEEGIAAYFEGFRWHPSDRTLPVFLPWSNPERFDTLRKIVAAGKLIPLDELLVSRPQDLLRVANGRTLAYYAQVWALTHFLHEGSGAKYRASLARLLRDAAAGRVAQTLHAELGPQATRQAMSRRVGDAVFRVYFNDDLVEAQAEYDRFVRAATLPGTRHDVTAGRSPLSE